MACSTGETKILPVADLVGLCGLDDRLDGAVDLIVVEHDVDLHLGQEIHDIFGAAVELGMAFLPAESLDLDHREPLNANLLQRLLDLIKLERLDDRFDLFHAPDLLAAVSGDFDHFSPARTIV